MPFASRPWFQEGWHRDLPACLVSIVLLPIFLSGAPDSQSGGNARASQFVELVLVSADLYSIGPCFCASLECAVLQDKLHIEEAPLPIRLNRDRLGRRAAPVWLLHMVCLKALYFAQCFPR